MRGSVLRAPRFILRMPGMGCDKEGGAPPDGRKLSALLFDDPRIRLLSLCVVLIKECLRPILQSLQSTLDARLP
jgi:hypothetical protein